MGAPFSSISSEFLAGYEHSQFHQRYSEQKNRLIKGQFSLVRQIAAQIPKVNLWEINITKVYILSNAVPNNKHSASFVDFISTLRWDPSHETVFLHTMKLALHTYIT